VQKVDTTAFRRSLQSAFLVFVIANAIFYLFYYLLFSVFDPGLVDLQRELLAENPLWQDNNTEADLSVTIGRVIFSFAYSLIGGFILALLVSAVARK
jgi:ABC-type nitrate/sulfonate/bicarbonate transport system permease component